VSRSGPGPASTDAVLRRAAAALVPRAGDLAAARIEAELLLAHVLGVERAALLTGPPLAEAEAAAFESLVAQRVESARPLAYTLGHRGFWDLDLLVDERVLIPRPETETVVETALELLARGQLPPGVFADRGTGSGCLALAVCDQRPVVAIDASADALGVAAANVARCGSGGRVLLVQADGLSCLAPRRLAAVLANPPYVEPAELERLPDEVRRHEPRQALVPREGSVAAMFARLLAESRAALVPRGWLITEVGAGQAALVTALASAAGYGWTEIRADAAGIERVVAARS
jgi:release factor glutamine methyltransferase